MMTIFIRPSPLLPSGIAEPQLGPSTITHDS
jgi:hypothetical protein